MGFGFACCNRKRCVRRCQRAGRPPQNWQLSSSITYESGTFGTGTRTETVYIPLTLKRLFDQGDIGLTLPFVTVRTAGETTLVEGRRIEGITSGLGALGFLKVREDSGRETTILAGGVRPA